MTKLATKGDRTETSKRQEEVHIHRGGQCKGYDELVGNPGMIRMLGVGLRNSGEEFVLAVPAEDLGYRLRYGSKACPECTAWLRTDRTETARN